MLSFLSRLRESFETTGVSEATVVFVPTFFLSGEAKEVLSEKFTMVKVDFHRDSPEASEPGSWAHLVQALLRGFITNEMLRREYDSVSREEHSNNEDEGKFAERISKPPRGYVVMYYH